MTTPILSVLLFTLWTIAVLLAGVGVHRWRLILTRKAQIGEFIGGQAPGTDFYSRATRAHANCVENLPLFAAVVFAAHLAGVFSPTIDKLSMFVVAARVAQSVIHMGSAANAAVAVRFAFFTVQLVCFVWIAVVTITNG